MERDFQIHRTEEDYSHAEFWKWFLSFAIGVVMGCIAFIVDAGIDVLNTTKYKLVENRIYSQGAPYLERL